MDEQEAPLEEGSQQAENREGFRWRPLAFSMTVLAATAMILLAPYMLAYWQAWRPIEFSATSSLPPIHYRWVVVVGRGRERMRDDETTVPFRGSRVAVYRNRNRSLSKVSREWLCRSESTAIYPPSHEDLEWLSSRHNSSTPIPYYYGHVSVPLGFYNLYDNTTERRRTFLISDWWRTDGRIALREPQVLRFGGYIGCSCQLTTSAASQKTPKEIKSTTLEKGSASLHGSPTREWSPRDSFGCLNLYDSERDDPDDPWQQFLAFLDAHGIDGRQEPLGLYIGRLEELTNYRGPLDSVTSTTPLLAPKLRMETSGTEVRCVVAK